MTSVLKGYASCNTRTNVATTWRTTSTFWLRNDGLLNKNYEGKWIGPLSHMPVSH